MDESKLIHCDSCGHENPLTHRFCGSCGATLDLPPSVDLASDEPGLAGEALKEENVDDRSGESQPGTRRPPSPSQSLFEDSITNPHELSLFRSFRPTDGEDPESTSESQPRTYRIYAGAILAILLGGLGYMAWRSSKLNSQSSREATPPPPAAAYEAANAPSNATETTPNPPTPAVATRPPSSARNSPQTPENAAEKEPIGNREKANPSAQAADSQTSQIETSATNGDQELAEAERYLNGGEGHGRDSAEAAKWLWKSIAKQNAEATLLLADLYLKGDGVSKNCDQARILLDSAARKGVSGAGERLRNLGAFGCQ